MHDRLKLPRRQRANKLDLILFWRDETSPEYRLQFGDDYLRFTRYVEREAQRLIESTWEER